MQLFTELESSDRTKLEALLPAELRTDDEEPVVFKEGNININSKERKGA